MYIVIVASIVAWCLTYLDSKNLMRGGMLCGFILLAFLGAIHYNYGSDYMGYYDIYRDINEYSFDLGLIFSGEVFKEPGWAIICYLFKPIGGFFTMVAVLNFLQNAIIYCMIKTEVERVWWPFALSIYLFNNAFYLLSFSMMRQELVMCIFLAIWPMIKGRKVLWSLLILFLCVLIHTSAIILLPFVFLGYLPVRNRKVIVSVFIILFFCIWWQRHLINDMMGLMSAIDNIAKYEKVYADSGESLSFGLGYLLNLIPLVLSMSYILQKHKDDNITRLVILSSVGYLLAPLSSVIPMISRLSYYFATYSIITTHRLYSELKNEYLKFGLLMIYIYMMFVGYSGFFSSPIYGEFYDTFYTIFPIIFEDWLLYFSLYFL